MTSIDITENFNYGSFNVINQNLIRLKKLSEGGGDSDWIEKYNSLKKNHLNPMFLRSEIMHWLKGRDIDHHLDISFDINRGIVMILTIPDPKQAMLFKLTWSGVQSNFLTFPGSLF